MGFENFIKKHFPGLETDEERAQANAGELKNAREARVQALLAEQANLEGQLKELGEWQGKDDYRTQHDNTRENTVREALRKVNDELEALRAADDEGSDQKMAA